MPSALVQMTAVDGTQSNASFPLPKGAFLKAVHVVSEGNIDLAPIFLSTFISDQPIGKASIQFNIGIMRGLITDQVSAVPVDFHGGVTWQGDLHLPTDYLVELHVSATNETGTDRVLQISYAWDDVPGGSGFSAQDPRLVWPSGATWMWRGVLTQTGAGGGNNVLNFSIDEGNEIIIQRILIGPDDYDAGNAVAIQILDQESTPNTIAEWQSTSLDNQTLAIPASRDAGTANNQQDTTSDLSRLLTGHTTLRIRADALIQNETLTVAIAARIRGVIPTIATTGSSGTVSLAITYSKVT